jgi:hypothetical protein
MPHRSSTNKNAQQESRSTCRDCHAIGTRPDLAIRIVPVTYCCLRGLVIRFDKASVGGCTDLPAGCRASCRRVRVSFILSQIRTRLSLKSTGPIAFTETLWKAVAHQNNGFHLASLDVITSKITQD